MAKSTSSIEDLLSKNTSSKLSGKQKATSTQTDDDQKTNKSKKTIHELSQTEKLESKLGQIFNLDKESAVASKAESIGVPYIDLMEFPVSAEALRLIPMNICQQQKIIAFVFTGDQIRFATTNPENPEIDKITNTIGEQQNAKIQIYLISEKNLLHGLDLYTKLPKYEKPKEGVSVSADELEKFKEIGKDFKNLQTQIEKVSLTEMVSLVIAAGLQSGASDVHIEAEEEDVKVRFRVDGVLHDTASIKKRDWEKVISRIKLLAGLKLNITEKPQDGRFTIHAGDEKTDVRTSTLPTTWGESVVMRLLKSSSIGLKFEELGITGKAYENLKMQTERPNGMIITTGPTGSGKTTTLYAILNKLNKEGVKIITMEDPVEYKLAGINQSQIDHSKGYSFADGLRSVLRQDPDVLMVGEMRDLETSDVAINAALTGHLVVSTIHTNSAAGAVPRFLAMGVKPFLLAPALNAIMGQRLVRRVCEKCKKEYIPSEQELTKVKTLLDAIPDNHPDKPDTTNMKFVKGDGCDYCNGLGYKGRVGVYEIMNMTPEIEQTILSGKVSEYDMEQIAIKNGMLTMAQDGLLKVLKGLTTIEEVFRVSE